MIREEDLREAIAECEGMRNPSSSTCLKLASYYTILNQMRKEPTAEREVIQTNSNYSYASAEDIPYSNSQFSNLVREKGMARSFPIIDEMMSALLMVNTRMYESIIRKLEDA